MIQNLQNLFVRTAHRVGMMSAPANRLFYAPEVKGAQYIAVTCGAFVLLSLILGTLGSVLIYLVWAVAAGAAYMIVRNLPKGQWPLSLLMAVVIAAGLSLLLWLLQAVFGAFSALTIPAALLGLYSWLGYKGGRDIDGPLRELGKHLGEEWSAFAPAHPLAANDSRVIKGPGKRLFFVSMVPGRQAQHYDDAFLEWDPSVAGRLDTVIAAEPRTDFKRVLWVLQPPQATGEHDMELSGGVTTYIGGAQRLAKNLQNWETMMENLHATHLDSSEFGLEVERQAIAALLKVLPGTWQVDTSVILVQGGDADIVLTSPLGRRYVVDVKARNDVPDLDENDPHRPKHWRDIHEQLMNASRQLIAEPVVWQPRARRGASGIFGEVRFVQGSASSLLRFLAEVHGEGVRGARVERGRNQIVEDHEPLGDLKYGKPKWRSSPAAGAAPIPDPPSAREERSSRMN